MKNDFDIWNELKKNIEAKTEELGRFPQTGEVWMTTLGKNIGYEQNGSSKNFSRRENKVSAILAQMKLMSLKRFKRNMYTLPELVATEIKQRLRKFLG